MTSGTASAKSKSHFDRGAWLTITLMTVFCLMTLVTTIYILIMPGDGWQMPYASQMTPAPLAHFSGD
jgi:hypothetical protein